jgi:hypothetical protein
MCTDLAASQWKNPAAPRGNVTHCLYCCAALKQEAHIQHGPKQLFEAASNAPQWRRVRYCGARRALPSTTGRVDPAQPRRCADRCPRTCHSRLLLSASARSSVSRVTPSGSCIRQLLCSTSARRALRGRGEVRHHLQLDRRTRIRQSNSCGVQSCSMIALYPGFASRDIRISTFASAKPSERLCLGRRKR